MGRCDTGAFETHEELLKAIWEMSFDGIPASDIQRRCGVSIDVFRARRGEALVSFEPTAEQLKKIKAV